MAGWTAATAYASPAVSVAARPRAPGCWSTLGKLHLHRVELTRHAIERGLDDP